MLRENSNHDRKKCLFLICNVYHVNRDIEWRINRYIEIEWYLDSEYIIAITCY